VCSRFVHSLAPTAGITHGWADGPLWERKDLPAIERSLLLGNDEA
jgi:hypothetical protein